MLGMLHDLDAAPQLAAGFADYRTHQLVAYLQDDPREVAVDAPVGDGASTLDAERIERRHHLGKTGVVLMVAGAGGMLVGTGLVGVGTIAALGGGTEGTVAGFVITGGVLAGGGFIAATTGEVMLFTGGIGASKLLGIPTTAGWVGVGLTLGAIVEPVAATAIGAEELAFLSPLMGIGGLVCGAVQLGQAGHAGRDSDVIAWHVVPTPHGMGIAGSF